MRSTVQADTNSGIDIRIGIGIGAGITEGVVGLLFECDRARLNLLSASD